MSLCPICSKTTDAEHRPFCSGRCKDVDLGRWFDGSYTLDDREESNVPKEETREH